jgi:hypothetical protein
MRVAASDPDIGVTEHLLHRRKGHALVEQQRRSRMPLCVHAPVLQPGALENVRPFLPVMPRIDRLAIRLAEHEIAVCPCPAGQGSFQGLRLLMLAKDRHQLRRDRNQLVPSFLDLAHDQPAALALGAPGSVLGAIRRARVRDLRAGMSALRAARRTVFPVPVFPTPFATLHPMQTFPAGVRISTAVAPLEPLQLKHNPGSADIEIEVLPAQPERFTLPQAKGETYRPASSIGPQRCLVEDHSHLM